MRLRTSPRGIDRAVLAMIPAISTHARTGGMQKGAGALACIVTADPSEAGAGRAVLSFRREPGPGPGSDVQRRWQMVPAPLRLTSESARAERARLRIATARARTRAAAAGPLYAAESAGDPARLGSGADPGRGSVERAMRMALRRERTVTVSSAAACLRT